MPQFSEQEITQALQDALYQNGYPVEKILPNKRYWLIRAYGGLYFRDFKENNFVGIGWDWELKIKEEKLLREMITQARVGAKIKRFEKEVNIEDIVIVPSVDTSHLMIGTIQSDYFKGSPTVPPKNDKGEVLYQAFPFMRRRRVFWLCTDPIPVRLLNPKIKMMIYTRHGIADVGAYAEYFNQALYPLYKEENNNLCMTLSVDGPEGAQFSSDEYADFFGFITAAKQNFNKIFGTQFVPLKEGTKLYVQSPGGMTFTGTSLGLLIAACAVVIWSGGEFKVGKFEFKAKGITESIVAFLNYLQTKKQEQNRHKESMHTLDTQHEESMYDLKTQRLEQILKLGVPTENISYADIVSRPKTLESTTPNSRDNG